MAAGRVREDGSVPPRLVATDLDGTLVRSDGTVSARTAAALQLARAAGAEVVFVTGRPVRWMWDVVRDTGLAGPAVCSNGALTYDLGRREVVARWLLEPGTAVEVGAALRTAVPGTAYAVEQESGFAREREYRPRYDWGMEHRVAELGDLCDAPLLKLLARHEELGSRELSAAAAPVLDGRVSVTWSGAAGHGLLEIAAPGVNKAAALSRLAAGYGIAAADVVAFGDMPNDLELMGWAGSAYAMANAYPEVIAAAGQVAPSNDEDGVAQVLEELFDPAAQRYMPPEPA